METQRRNYCTNLLDFDGKKYFAVCRQLDYDELWKRLIECAEECIAYRVNLHDVEKFGRASSPTESLLSQWGQRGMTVEKLIQFLDILRLEKPLLFLRSQGPLKITVQPVSNLHLSHGEILRLNCEAVGFPYPRYVWFKGQTQLLPVNQSGLLVIRNASCGDSGEYTCRVQHQYKSRPPQGILSSPCRVHVDPLPVVPHLPVVTEHHLRMSNPIFTATDKVVLMFGISKYTSTGLLPLPAVSNDVKETVTQFEKLGFKVLSLLDVTLSEMLDAVQMFYSLLPPKAYVVLYCAGHGFEYHGRHYLMPVDASCEAPKRQSLCIEKVEVKIQSRSPSLLLILLDICRKTIPDRNNGHLASLSRTEIPVIPNKVVIFATGEGEEVYEETAGEWRGIFSGFFLEALKSPRITCNEIFSLVLESFKNCTSRINRGKYPQHPEFKSNLEECGRSLWDPVNNRLDNDIKQVLKRRWESVHWLPEDMSYTLPNTTSISLHCTRIASNVLQVVVRTRLNHGVDCQIDIVDVDGSDILKPVKKITQTNDICFIFHNLQRLKCPLRLELKMTVWKDDPTICESTTLEVKFGTPLFAACNPDSQLKRILEPRERSD